MGGGRWSSTDWDTYAAKTTRGKAASEIFTSRTLKDDYNPALFAFRESCNGPDNPRATPIIIGSDVTGSMGMVAHKLMQDGLNTLVTEIIERKPVTDPHVLVAAIGDTCYDRAPFQATQFEADIRLADQVKSLWVEGGGGGNSGESYLGAHIFAAMKTKTDAAAAGRKGYLFTIGDEPNLGSMSKDHLKRFFNLDVQQAISAEDAVAMAMRNWHVYHIVLVKEGHCRYDRAAVVEGWRKLLPQTTIELEDVNALAETVVSLIQVNEGAMKADVAASWGDGRALVVANALRSVTASAGGGTGLRRLGA